MELIALPALSDNYIWVLHDGRSAWVVDPGDSRPVIACLIAHSLTLSGIVVTHHHSDHIDGIASLKSRLQGPVVGPVDSRIPGITHTVAGGDRVEMMGLTAEVLAVPGHSLSHLAYFLQEVPGLNSVLFCGDSLFSGGCGRLFEGSPEQMHRSLTLLAALPETSSVCCTHEYTLSNLEFARAAEPGNLALVQYQDHCQALRSAGRPTLPSSIAQEKAINPFLRCHEPSLIRAALEHGAASESSPHVFAALRRWKDHFL